MNGKHVVARIASLQCERTVKGRRSIGEGVGLGAVVVDITEVYPTVHVLQSGGWCVPRPFRAAGAKTVRVPGGLGLRRQRGYRHTFVRSQPVEEALLLFLERPHKAQTPGEGLKLWRVKYSDFNAYELSVLCRQPLAGSFR